MSRPSYRGFRGSFLKELREQRGWTQEQLAIATSVFPPMIGKWEREQVVPEARSVARLAEVLGVRPQDFTSVTLEDSTLVDLRLFAGLTRAEAAEAAGISDRRLFTIEHLTQRPRPEHAAALARVYGVSPAQLYEVWDREHGAMAAGLLGPRD